MAPDSNTETGCAAVGGRVVDDRRHPVVGGDRQEIGPELLAAADVDRDDPVGQAGLLEEQGDLVPVRGRPVVQVDHAGAASC